MGSNCGLAQTDPIDLHLALASNYNRIALNTRGDFLYWLKGVAVDFYPKSHTSQNIILRYVAYALHTSKCRLPRSRLSFLLSQTSE